MQKPKQPSVINHLFILDESASMQVLEKEALYSFNDTRTSILKEAERNGQDHRITLLSFNGGGIKQHYFNRPIDQVPRLESGRFHPNGASPLMDCIGLGIGLIQVSLKRQPADARVMVTIVTDGSDNGSRKYCATSIAALIRSLKRSGWIFNYIGANHAVRNVSRSLGIDNCFAFKQSGSDVKQNLYTKRLAREALQKTWNKTVSRDTIRAA